MVSRGYIFKGEELSFGWEDLKRGPTFLVGGTILGFLGRHQEIAYCPHPSPYARVRKGRYFFHGLSQKPCSFKRKFFCLGKTIVSRLFFYGNRKEGRAPAQGPQVKAQDTGGSRPKALLGFLGPFCVSGPEGPRTLWDPECQGPARIRGPRALLRPPTGATSKKKYLGPLVKGVRPHRGPSWGPFH